MDRHLFSLIFAVGIAGLAFLRAEEPARKDAPAEPEPATMEKKKSFEFQDSPLVEVVGYLREMARANVILDPKLVAANPPAVTWKPEEMTLREAFDRVAQAAQARVYWRNGAYFISRTPPAAAEEKPAPPQPAPPLSQEQRREIEQAIRELGHENYETREAASARILKTGPAAAPLLEAALKVERDDPERQARLTILVAELDAEANPLAAPLKRKISFCTPETPLAEVMDLFTQISGVHFVADPEIANASITLQVNNMELGLTVIWVARLADAKVIKSGNTVRLAPAGRK